MPRSRNKIRGRGKSPPFVRLFHKLLDHPDYISLSHPAKALLIDVMRQYNGHNNGDFCVTLSLLSKRGWTSNDTLRRALNQLLASGLLIQSRQGGRNYPSLYAITFEPINDCGGKIEIAPTQAAPRPLSLSSLGRLTA